MKDSIDYMEVFIRQAGRQRQAGQEGGRQRQAGQEGGRQ